MPGQTFDIIFSGQLMEDRDPNEVRQQIGRIFNANASQLDKLFSGNPVIIKSGVDDETATKYRVAFRKAGALIEIKLTPTSKDGIDRAATQNDTSRKETEGPTLLPPNTGSLIDCAKEVKPQPIPDTSHMSLASLGTIIDESSTHEPVEIDTTNLSMSPPNTGTLEDCKKDVEPYPIPDISYLDMDKR